MVLTHAIEINSPCYMHAQYSRNRSRLAVTNDKTAELFTLSLTCHTHTHRTHTEHMLP